MSIFGGFGCVGGGCPKQGPQGPALGKGMPSVPIRHARGRSDMTLPIDPLSINAPAKPRNKKYKRQG